MVRTLFSSLVIAVVPVLLASPLGAKPKTYGSFMAEGGKAEDQPAPQYGPVTSGGVIVTDTAECRLVPIHRPAPDVTYRPGTDVQGNAVPPADMAGSGAVQVPAEVTIGIQVPITEFLGADVPPFLDQAEIDAGQVTVNTQTGALFYNGQRLDVPYAVLCEEKAE